MIIGERASILLAVALAAGLAVGAEVKPSPVVWPDVLLIDDFANGFARWENRDSGVLGLTEGRTPGQQAMLWTSTDDSDGEIVFKNLRREEVDFSQYDLLVFDLKISGRPVWNVGPRLQQHPAVYGFRGLYYSVDTLHPFDRWFTCSQDLSRWENVDDLTRNGFDVERQEFSFGITQLAAAGRTEVALANIRLVKNPLGVKPSYPGRWGRLPDGSQATHFAVELENRREQALTVSLGLDAADPGTLKQFRVKVPEHAFALLPGERRVVNIDVVAPADVLKSIRPWYGETARLAVRVAEIPELVLHAELVAGTRPEAVAHPVILCDPERMKAMHKTYADAERRPGLGPALLRMVAVGEAALAYVPEYPPSAAPGRTKDPVSGGKLQRIDVPNLPFAVYQDPLSGRTYSGPLYDAGMEDWLGRHRANAATAHTLGVAYLISGRREFAQAAARILRDYIDRYLELPINAFEPGSPVGSACSGSVRIDGTFMRERIWLGHLAIALDSIRASGVLDEGEIRAISDKIFTPSAMNMMDHKIGVMNLQMMINSAALYAGMAVDNPGLVAQSFYGSHGVARMMDIGYLAEGFWWENPSYQTVMNLCAFPVMAIAVRSGMIEADERLVERLTAYYRLAGPDGFTPELGTGNAQNGALNNTVAHVFAPLIADPRLAWAAYNTKPAPHVGELYTMAVIGGGKPRIPPEQAVNPFATGTVNFPDYGGIALRIAETNAYAYLHYGREVTHGHLNKLSVHAYGKGGWYLRNVMGGYGHNFHDFLETIASSTSIMVDGRNANRDTGELLFSETTGDYAVASARENAAWLDVRHERTVVLTCGPLILIDRCFAEAEHVYDWLYHANWTGLSLDPLKPLAAGPERLGDSPLYSGLKPVGVFPSVGAVDWKRENGSGMRMALLPRGELFHIDVSDATRPSEGLVWRQRGRTVHYAAALWPHFSGEAGAPRIEELPVTGDGFAVRVTAPEGAWIVIVNYGEGSVSAAGIEATKRVTVVSATEWTAQTSRKEDDANPDR